MINRYSSRTQAKNDLEMYENVFRERGVKFINQYKSPNFTFISYEDTKYLTIIQRVWTVGDRYFKLANEYYGDSKDWWVIAKYNNKPTESHVAVGDIILIPKPLNLVLDLMRG